MKTNIYGTYVVRIWLEPSGDSSSAWRASVSKEKYYFAEPAELSNYLLAHNLPLEPLATFEPEDKGATRLR